MSAPLHVLLITADEAPPLLALRANAVAHTWQRVDTLANLRVALEAVIWDVAVLDAGYAAIPPVQALATIGQYDADLPLVVLTGSSSEADALVALRAGARDVVLYEQPGRIALAIERAAQEARERRERRLAEGETARQAARAESLVRSAGRLNAHLDRGAVISTICEETVRGLGADMVCVALPGEGGAFEIVGCAGRSQALIAAALPVAERYLSRVAGLYLPEQGWTILESRLLGAGRPLGRLVAVFADPVRAPAADERALLSGLADQAGIALDNAALLADLQASNNALAAAYDATLERWVHALDLRDREDEGHTRRVTAITVRLAESLGFDEASVAHIRRGALLHDIGKLAVPDRILQKPGPLDEAEWALMRRHPVYAYEWLAPISFLRPALDIPYCHHERWDGGGYPRGLQAQDIPLPARIFALADTWDTLRSERPYKPAYSEVKALQIITAEAGRQLDPSVVAMFLRLLPELRARTI